MVKKGRKPQNETKVPFQEILPLTLKDRVSGKGDGSRSELACIPEMQALFACFKRNDFEQNQCLSEVKTFRKCFEEFRASQSIKKEQLQSDVMTPGVKTITSRQLNIYLKKFPHPK